MAEKKIRKARIPSMRKPRRVLVALGTCGIVIGSYLITKTFTGDGKHFLMIGLVYILVSFFLIGLGQALVGISRVHKKSLKRKSVQR